MTEDEPKTAIHPDRLTPAMLRRLSPNRTHESNWLKSLLCRIGLHHWYAVELPAALSGQRISLRRYCPKAQVGGVVVGESGNGFRLGNPASARIIC